jgi:hypothetical protein
MSMLDLNSVIKAVSHLIKFPKKQMWLDYDADADVIYCILKKSLVLTIVKCAKMA